MGKSFMGPEQKSADVAMMRLALRLARRGLGCTSPNPMVGAVLVKRGVIVGRGWHHRAGEPHAEIEALRDAATRGCPPKGATLYVTLEPCCTHGRTPPCTDAIIAAGIKRVVVAATDPNPDHAGRGFNILKHAGITVAPGVLAEAARQLNEAFNHWIIHRTPLVTVKAAMTLDGKIATAAGESKWITGPAARAEGMKLRRAADAILVGINTVLADDPALTVRGLSKSGSEAAIPRVRIVVDSNARTPLTARLVTDEFREQTLVVVTPGAPKRRVAALSRIVNVLSAPERGGKIDLRWLLGELGRRNITNLLVEGGGEVNASFLLAGLAHRVVFFYAPMILGGRDARPGVGGDGFESVGDMLKLRDVRWNLRGPDLMLTARVA